MLSFHHFPLLAASAKAKKYLSSDSPVDPYSFSPKKKSQSTSRVRQSSRSRGPRCLGSAMVRSMSSSMRSRAPCSLSSFFDSRARSALDTSLPTLPSCSQRESSFQRPDAREEWIGVFIKDDFIRLHLPILPFPVSFRILPSCAKLSCSALCSSSPAAHRRSIP